MALFEGVASSISSEIVLADELIDALVGFLLLEVIFDHFLAFRQREGKQSLLHTLPYLLGQMVDELHKLSIGGATVDAFDFHCEIFEGELVHVEEIFLSFF
jgi:hypothetical protein